MSILSINGNRSMNVLLQTVLAKKHKLIMVPDAFGAMYHLKRHPDIELVIVDMDYQPKENQDFIDHIQTSCLYAKPVIVLTSNKNNNELGELFADVRICTYFIKPFNPLELLQCVDELVKPVTIIDKN